MYCQFEWFFIGVKRENKIVSTTGIRTRELLDTNYLVPRKFTRSDISAWNNPILKIEV